MPTVVLDVTRIRTLYSGLGQFAFHLAKNLLVASGETMTPCLYLHQGTDRLFSGEDPHVMFTKPWHREWVPAWLRPTQRARNEERRFSVWHTLDQLSSYLPADPRIPVVLTIHDLNFPDRPPAAVRRGLRQLQARVNRSTVITTVSSFAAGQIRDLLDIGRKDIHIIPPGLCTDTATEPQRPSFISSSGFLFSIGEFRSTKNFHQLVELMRFLPNHHLVIAGNHETEYGRSVRGMVESAGLSGRIHLPGIVSDAERQWLFRNCEALLFPSTAEGFGMPVIEAMSFGRPVFTTRISSLPDTAGPFAYYWDSARPEQMGRVVTEGMEHFARDATLSAKLESYARQFSWSQTAARYLEIYESCLHPNAA